MMLQTNKNYKALLIDDLQLFNKYDKKSLSRLNDIFKNNNYAANPIIVTCDTTTSKMIINLIKSTAYIVLLLSKTKLTKLNYVNIVYLIILYYILPMIFRK